MPDKVYYRFASTLTALMFAISATKPATTLSTNKILYVSSNKSNILESAPDSTYTTIQDAVNYADSGDVIVVAPGTYYENVRFPPAKPGLTLLSKAGPSATIIDGQGLNSTIEIVDTTLIDGFTIRHGGGSVGFATNGYGVAIIADKNFGTPMTVVLQHNVITENMGRGGVGFIGHVAPYHVSALISHNRIAMNSGELGLAAGGIFFDLANGNGGTIDIVNNLVFSNTGYYGGGLNLGSNAATYTAINIFNNTLYGNRAAFGGGVYGNSVGINFVNNITISNTASFSGNDFYLIQQGLTAQISNNIIGDGQFTGVRGNFVDNPMFVNATLGDFRLQPASPAIDSGSSVPITDDFAMWPRPVDGDNSSGNQWDIGAYEYYPPNKILSVFLPAIVR